MKIIANKSFYSNMEEFLDEFLEFAPLKKDKKKERF